MTGEDLGHVRCPTEHVLSVEAHDQKRCGDEHRGFVGLGVRPERMDELEMHQDGEEDAAARGVERLGEHDTHGHRADREMREGPGALRRCAQDNGRQVPQPPDDAEDRTGPMIAMRNSPTRRAEGESSPKLSAQGSPWTAAPA